MSGYEHDEIVAPTIRCTGLCLARSRPRPAQRKCRRGLGDTWAYRAYLAQSGQQNEEEAISLGVIPVSAVIQLFCIDKTVDPSQNQ